MGDIIPTVDGRTGSISGKAVELVNDGTLWWVTIKTPSEERVRICGDHRMMKMMFEDRKPNCALTVEGLNTEDETFYFDEDQ